MMSNHCIYTHTSPSGKVYVGQTINAKRRWGYNGEHYKNKKEDGSYVQEAFARAIEKYGWDSFEHSIVLDGISKTEADYAEKYLIKWYKLHNQSYNITDGGEGTCGHHAQLSEEARNKLLVFLRTTPPMKGKHHSEETKKKISAAFKGKKLSDERRKQMSEISKGRKHSEESKAKMSEYRKSHPETWIGGWNKKEVHQYDLEGKYVASYSSICSAAKSLGYKAADISKCIRGEMISAYGFIWKLEKVDSIDISMYKFTKTNNGVRAIDMSEEGRRKRRNNHGKAVNQYTLDGIYLTTFNSVTDAKEAIKYYGSGINKCCLHHPKYKTAGGYLWEFDTIDNRNNINKTAAKKS